jgi:L-seryl-tRNA(Ser) seleniumtransferase
MPEVELPSMLISLTHSELTAEQLGRTLRINAKPAIIARINKDELVLDLRTVSKEDEDHLLKALINVKGIR